jgi:hypothetical protein
MMKTKVALREGQDVRVEQAATVNASSRVPASFDVG